MRDDGVWKAVCIGYALHPARLANGIRGVPVRLNVNGLDHVVREDVEPKILDKIVAAYGVVIAVHARLRRTLQPRVDIVVQIPQVMMRIDLGQLADGVDHETCLFGYRANGAARNMTAGSRRSNCSCCGGCVAFQRAQRAGR